MASGSHPISLVPLGYDAGDAPPPRPLRLAVLTLEALAAAGAVRRFVASHAARIAMVGLSDPFRADRGGIIGQTRHLLDRSGPRLLPYMAANFVLPRLAGWLPRWPTQDPAATRLLPLCARLGIPAEVVADMNGPRFRDRLAASGADAILTFHCDQILTAGTIATLPRGGFNVHAGLLPDHRGPTPTIHALLDPAPRFGVTIHRLVPRIDAGAILAQAPVDLPTGITALEAARHLHDAAVPLLAEVLTRLDSGTALEYPVEPGPYCGFPTPAELRALARVRRRTVGWSDVARALRTPV